VFDTIRLKSKISEKIMGKSTDFLQKDDSM